MRIRVAAAALTLLAALPLAAAAPGTGCRRPDDLQADARQRARPRLRGDLQEGRRDRHALAPRSRRLRRHRRQARDHSRRRHEERHRRQSGRDLLPPRAGAQRQNVGKGTIKVTVTELKETAPSGTLSDAERAQLLDLFERGQRELEELVASTPDELWAKKPAPERWSVAEVVEHLGAAEGLLFGMSQQALAAPASSNWALVEGGLSTENFMTMLQDRSKKFQAPEPIQPKGGMTRADALAKFAGARAVSAEFVRRTTLPVKKHLADGPAGKMTVHQVLVLLGGHNAAPQRADPRGARAAANEVDWSSWRVGGRALRHSGLQIGRLKRGRPPWIPSALPSAVQRTGWRLHSNLRRELPGRLPRASQPLLPREDPMGYGPDRTPSRCRSAAALAAQ